MDTRFPTPADLIAYIADSDTQLECRAFSGQYF
jgi:hypothetical protein